jgi:hypothetical protein
MGGANGTMGDMRGAQRGAQEKRAGKRDEEHFGIDGKDGVKFTDGYLRV